MATRVNRKNAPTVSPKEVVTTEKTSPKNEPSSEMVPKSSGTSKPIGKKLNRNLPKKIIKKPTLGVKLKAKVQKLKLNPLAKSVLKNSAKKKFLRNGIKEIKPRKKKIKKELDDQDSPPVLEPIFPLEENLLGKNQPKTRGSKKRIKNEAPQLTEIKIKQETADDESFSSKVTDTSFSDIPTLPKQIKRGRPPKISKVVENETLEDVMNDLTYLIKAEDIKKEPDTLSDSSRSDTTKSKKLTKKQKMELLKKNMIKKENIENTLSKLDSSDEKIIDMLDLNVTRLKKKSPISKRRHSIEKCPVGPMETSLDTLNIFNHLPRSISPRAKRKGKPEGSSRRSSPYSTRSDTPARILRNGKQRKLESLGLLEGLELDIKKRKRLCSDSGSKLSGYDSDSSFSDRASSHGTENNEANKDDDKDIKPSISTAPNGPIDNLGLVDNNSNIYSSMQIPIVDTMNTEEVSLPDKNVLLDIMKQTFNSDIDIKKSSKVKLGTVVPSRFYGKRNTGSPQGKPETILKEDVSEKIADEAPLMDDEAEINLSSAVQEVIESLAENCGDVPQTGNTQPDNSENLRSNLEPLMNNTINDLHNFTVNSQCLDNNLQGLADHSQVLPEISESMIESAVTPHYVAYEAVIPNLEIDVLKKGDVTEFVNYHEATICDSNNTKNSTSVPPNLEIDVLKKADVPEFVNYHETTISDSNITKDSTSVEPVTEPPLRAESPPPLTAATPSLLEDSIVPPLESISPPPLISVTSQPVNTETVGDGALENLQPVNLEESVTEGTGAVFKAVDTDNLLDNPDNLFESANGANVTDSVPMEEDEISEPVLTENNNAVIDNNEEDLINLNPYESEEKIAEKESILKALGLQRLQQNEEAKQKTKEKPLGFISDSYTGTLKTVIKINRDKKKVGRPPTKNLAVKGKPKITSTEEEQAVSEEAKEKENKEKEASSLSSSTWKQGTQSSDTAGAHRKSHYSNRSNLDGSSEHTSDGETQAQDGTIKALVIPEKASSFSIHPGRLCKDECSYCFGKFGLFDTPCHIAQMKSVDRQNKILARNVNEIPSTSQYNDFPSIHLSQFHDKKKEETIAEKHLTRDSCLCDACYRHVDRKSNTPSYMNKSLKRSSLVAPGPRQNHCHVLGCSKESSNILRRKWIIKMRKSICQVINLDLDNPGLHSIPICEDHYAALEHLMICAMCKRRLARNHIHYLGPEITDLNNVLNSNGIPLKLYDKPVVCKLCKCFASIILKDPSERAETSNNFFVEYRKRLLHFNDIIPMDESAAEEPITVPSKAERLDILKGKKKLLKNPAGLDDLPDGLVQREERVPSTDTNSQPQSRSGSPSDEYNGVDYNTLIPAIAMDVGSDTESKRDIKTPVIIKKLNDMQGVEIVKVIRGEKTKPTDSGFQKFAYGPSVSVRQLFQGEEDLPLTGHIDFNNVKEKTPEGWEKCNTVIQYDEETKRLWQELQKPYGNQSSFLRHLILLEKYFRNGDLVLSPRASHHSINYSESVHNRLKAYDNIPTSAGNIQPLSMLPFNKVPNRSSSGIITSGNMMPSMNNSISTHPPLAPSTITSSRPVGTTAMSITTVPSNVKSAPLTISQLNSPPLLPANAILHPLRPKTVGQPPGLISLHPGTTRPVAPLVKVPQPQKIKFPITKNWRPNLIPIDPTKERERKTGLVQVISGGKPYHITLEDYKKMCAIKRSFEMKQKRLQEAQAPKPILVTHNSILKSIIPRKGLVISKTATVSTPSIPQPPPTNDGPTEEENILEKLDKQVEKLESKLNEKPSSLLLPRIPKSLTVIPQTVTKRPSRPSSPVLLITSKNSSSKS